MRTMGFLNEHANFIEAYTTSRYTRMSVSNLPLPIMFQYTYKIYRLSKSVIS